MNSKVVDYCGDRRGRIVGIAANSSTWKQEAGTLQFSHSRKECQNDKIVWEGLLPVFGYSSKILPKTTWWRRWMGRNHIFYVVNLQFHELSKNPKSGLLSCRNNHWTSKWGSCMLWKFMASVVQKLEFLQFEIHWTHFSLWSPRDWTLHERASWTQMRVQVQKWIAQKKSVKKKGCALRREKSNCEPQVNLGSSELLEKDADPVILTPNQERVCTKWAIPLNEKVDHDSCKLSSLESLGDNDFETSYVNVSSLLSWKYCQ